MKDFLRLLQLAKPHKGWMSIGIGLALITTLSNIALLSVSGWFIASMAAAGITGVAMNYFTPAGIIRFLAIVRTGGRYTERYVTHDVTLKILSEIRVWFYQHLEPLAPAQLQGLRSGDLLSRIQADVERLDNFYLRILLPVIVATIAAPIVLAITYHYDTQLALILFTGLFIIGIALPYWIVYSNKTNAQQSVTTSAELRTNLIDGIQGMRELIIYQAEQKQIETTQQLSDKLLTQQDKTNQVSSTAQGASVLFINLTVWLSVWLLIPQVANGEHTNTNLVMLTLLILASFEIVMPLTLAFEQAPIVLASLRRLLHIIDTQPTRIEPIQKSPQAINGSISFSNVNFSYTDQLAPTLQDISFEINSGEKIAIVGASGAGKSSIANLLLGFWQANSGNIKIAGHNIDHFQGDDLRKHIAMVAQHSHLFTATIRDNLILANPDADQALLDKACATAGLTEFIADLPEGYDTWLGEAGTGLSGGQARRLNIAQALLKPAEILILDEPSEGLDVTTERQVMHAVFELMKNRTVLLITHSPVMLQKMDKIYVMEQGRIIASGTHQTLLQSNEIYQNQLRFF